MAEEANLQSNCIRAFAREVAAGRIYFYRVLKPERATISIVECAQQRWKLQEIKGPCNQLVAFETELAIEEWISSGHETKRDPLVFAGDFEF